LGRTEYDTRLINTIAARVSGRIEKLYVKYRYQHVHKGDRIMDIYSPELITGQQNLLFLLKNDATNLSLINAAKQRLLLLGMSNQQLQQMISTDKTIYAVTVYSNYMGHIHEAMGMQPNASPQMDVSVQTEELAVKEGMYVTKGQTVFQLFNTDRSWVSLNIYADQAATIKKGTPVTITAETIGDKSFQAQIDFIEPFFRSNTKTITARVYIKNEALQIPIGSQVKATLHVSSSGEWLPQQAVLSLGLNKVVLLKDGSAFKVHPVNTGISANDSIQIVAGLNINDSVASNAQFLMDSESFLKIKQ
jgi:Cu(I)/Ag(I) efflux system membrane fusion protein